MKLFKLLPTIPVLLVVAACAQPEPAPEPIMPEPVYNKYSRDGGGGGCAGGGQAGGSANCIPETGEQGYEQPGSRTQDGGGDGDGSSGGDND